MTKKQAKKSTEQIKQAVAVPVVPPAVAATKEPLASTSAPAQPSKQQAVVNQLVAGWAEQGTPIDKLTITTDGKYQVLVVAEGWPSVAVGPTGGIVVRELRSYQKAYDAAMNGKELYAKQLAREAKKASATAPAAKAPAAAKATTEAVTA